MDSSSSQESPRSARPPKRAQRQQTFMFIDSSNGGMNMKPNKAVRSFVMHQARRHRPWSTRKVPPSPDTPGQKKSPAQEHHSPGSLSPTTPPWLEYDPHSKGRRDSLHLAGAHAGRRQSHPGLATPPASTDGACTLLYCNGAFCGQKHAPVIKLEDLALGTLDPFDCLAVKTDPKTSALIDHFATMLSPLLIPVDLHQQSTLATTDWLSTALTDSTSGAPFTYALLCGSALHLQAVGDKSIENPLFYKSRAIAEINANLSNPETSTSDNNIAAVFMLLTIEESMTAPPPENASKREKDEIEWSEMQKTVHLNGLRTMIQQRGGLSALGGNRCLQVFILMHAIAHSVASFHPPYTTLLDGNNRPQKYDLPSFRSRPSNLKALKHFKDLKIDFDLLELTSNISTFVADISAKFSDRRTPVEPLELQKHISLLTYRLYDWYANPDESRNSLDQCICLALLIFLVRVSEPQGYNFRPLTITAVRKLREALQKTNIFRWAKSPDLLLWTLTIGALAAQGSAESEFFTQYFSITFADAGFEENMSSDDLLARVQKVMWAPTVFDREVKKLWVGIGIARKEEEEEGALESLIEKGMMSPEIKDDDAVGVLTSSRFFSSNS